MHRARIRQTRVGWALRASTCWLACALLCAGLWPAHALEPVTPFAAWRYDAETGWRRSLGYPASRTAWGLAEFAPAGGLEITAVQVWTTDAAAVDVYLYDGFDGTALGSRLAAQTGSAFEQAGSYAVSLSAPVPVMHGEPVVVVVRITNAVRGHPLLLDSEDGDDQLRSFASPNGENGSWYDVSAKGYGSLAISVQARPLAEVQAGRGKYRSFLPLVASGGPLPSDGWTVLLEEDFEGDFPGVWQLSDGNPAEGQYLAGRRDCRVSSGSYSGWLVGGGEGAALGCQSAYPRHAQSWMVYGPFSLTGASDAELAFQLWLYSEPKYDGLFAGASIDGTAFHGYMLTGDSAGWIEVRLNLRAVPELGDLTGGKEVWVALLFVSDGVVRMQEGAYVDEIVLRSQSGIPSEIPVVHMSGEAVHWTEATFSLYR